MNAIECALMISEIRYFKEFLLRSSEKQFVFMTVVIQLEVGSSLVPGNLGTYLLDWAVKEIPKIHTFKQSTL